MFVAMYFARKMEHAEELQLINRQLDPYRTYTGIESQKHAEADHE